MKTVYPLIFLVCFMGISGVAAQSLIYPWTLTHNEEKSINNRVPVPDGFVRTVEPPASYGHWLRFLPLKKSGQPVLLFNRKPKLNQAAHYAVIDIDVGDKDLQQCADFIIRLRAEYLYSINAHHKIAFNFTSGDRAFYSQWSAGYRPNIQGNRVNWVKTAVGDNSYAGFKRYLEKVFIYAGSYSLSHELKSVKINELLIGDVFIQGGFPGHAVIVVDRAKNPQTGEIIFLLAQSFMPAQDAHLLNNPNGHKLNPWYSVNFGSTLKTPEWNFSAEQLKRFKP